MKLTNFKIIISGSTIETYRYQEKAVSYDFVRFQKGVSIFEQNLSVDEKLEKKLLSRKSSMLRSRSTLRRLVNSNAWRWLKPSGLSYLPVFVTLTFKDDVRNSKVANKIFSDFIRRFNYYITDGEKKSFLKYVVVIEFQDKNRGGVVHYHVMFFNMKKVWTDTIAKIWGQGFVHIKKIDRVDNVGAYMSKYMSKHFEDDRLDGKRRYFPSNDLFRPTEIRDQNKALLIEKLIPEKYLAYEKDFTSVYLGQVKYRQYKLDKRQSLSDIIPNLRELLK